MRGKKKEDKDKKKKKKKEKENLKNTLEMKLPQLEFENIYNSGVKLGMVKSAAEVERILELNKKMAEENMDNISIVVNTPGLNEESIKKLKEEDDIRKREQEEHLKRLLEEENMKKSIPEESENEYTATSEDDYMDNTTDSGSGEEIDIKELVEEKEPVNENVDNNKIIDDEKTELLNKPKAVKVKYFLELKNGIKVEINRKVFRVGRNREFNDYYLLNKKVSSKHAEFVIKNGKIYVKDLNSTNGIFLDGIKIPQGAEVEIKIGQKIVLANEELILGKEEIK